MVNSKADHLSVSKMLNANLDEEPDPVMQRKYRDEETFPKIRLESLASFPRALSACLSDGGLKLRKTQQYAKAELERRARVKFWVDAVRSCQVFTAGSFSFDTLCAKPPCLQKLPIVDSLSCLFLVTGQIQSRSSDEGRHQRGGFCSFFCVCDNLKPSL